MPIVDVDLGLGRPHGQVVADSTLQLEISLNRLLVHQHLVAVRVHRLVVDNRGQRGPGRWPLEPHLRNESCRPISILCVVDEVPHVPDVNRAVPVVIGMVVLGE